MDSDFVNILSNFLYRQGIVQVDWCCGIDCKDHFIKLSMQLSWWELYFLLGWFLLSSLIILKIIEMMFKEEAITLAINGHGFANDLMNIGIGPSMFPDSKGGNNIDAFDYIQYLVKFLIGEILSFFRMNLSDIFGEYVNILLNQGIKFHFGEPW